MNSYCIYQIFVSLLIMCHFHHVTASDQFAIRGVISIRNTTAEEPTATTTTATATDSRPSHAPAAETTTATATTCRRGRRQWHAYGSIQRSFTQQQQRRRRRRRRDAYSAPITHDAASFPSSSSSSGHRTATWFYTAFIINNNNIITTDCIASGLLIVIQWWCSELECVANERKTQHHIYCWCCCRSTKQTQTTADAAAHARTDIIIIIINRWRQGDIPGPSNHEHGIRPEGDGSSGSYGSVGYDHGPIHRSRSRNSTWTFTHGHADDWTAAIATRTCSGHWGRSSTAGRHAAWIRLSCPLCHYHQ